MRAFKIILLLVMLAFIGVIGGAAYFMVHPLQMAKSPSSFTIPAGSSLRGAAQAIESAGVDLPAWQLVLLGRFMGSAAKIKAGSYEVEQGITAVGLLEKMMRGDVTQGELVLVEGRSFRQFRNLLNENPDLRHDTQPMSDAQLLAAVGARETHPEGLFFPDTYMFDKGASDLDVLRRAYHAMQKRLLASWAQRDPSVPLKSPYELLILASIIEKETGLPSDRPQVAAVFVNRLRRGMLLQTDPTVIYGLGERFDGNLRKIDLQTDTPWNTYTRAGLPPTPIAMPGQASLQAVANPPASNMIYFVARGDGSSVFSQTLDQHNAAVTKYQRR